MLPDELILAIFAFAYVQNRNIIFTFRRLATRYHALFSTLILQVRHKQHITDNNLQFVLSVFKQLEYIDYYGKLDNLELILDVYTHCKSLSLIAPIDFDETYAMRAKPKTQYPNITHIHCVGQKKGFLPNNFHLCFPNIQYLALEEEPNEEMQKINPKILHITNINLFRLHDRPNYHTIIAEDSTFLMNRIHSDPSIIRNIYKKGTGNLLSLARISFENIRNIYIDGTLDVVEGNYTCVGPLDFMYIKRIFVRNAKCSITFNAKKVHIHCVEYKRNKPIIINIQQDATMQIDKFRQLTLYSSDHKIRQFLSDTQAFLH